MKQYSESTLMRMTKKELADEVRIAQHNQHNAEVTLRKQAANMMDWEPVRHGTWNGKKQYTFLSLDHNGAPIYGSYPAYVCSCCERY